MPMVLEDITITIDPAPAGLTEGDAAASASCTMRVRFDAEPKA